MIIDALLVVFGGTGDLAHRKLYPAVYNLYLSGLLPENFALVAVGRRDKSIQDFRSQVMESIREYSRNKVEDIDKLEKILARFYYYKKDFYDSQGYERLGEFLKDLDDSYKTRGNRVFYLAVAPEHFGPIVERIHSAGLAPNGKNPGRGLL